MSRQMARRTAGPATPAAAGPAGIVERSRGTNVRTDAHVVVKKRKRVRVPRRSPHRFTLRGPGLDASFTLSGDRRIRGQRNGTPFTGRLPTAGSLLI